MAELKTRENNKSVDEFIAAVVDENKRNDCLELLALMTKVTAKDPRMWGDSIVGFGKYHYKYKSGREGDWFVTGFAPRKRDLTIYIMPGFSGYGALMAKLGKFRTGKSCLYVRKLDDIDPILLEELVKQSVKTMREMYVCE